MIDIVIGISSLAICMILKRHWVDLMFQQHQGWAFDILFGMVLTVIAMATLFIIFLRSCWLKVQDWQRHIQPVSVWLGILWNSLLINAYTAIGEVVIFRGYLLSGLKGARGKGICLAITAILFASIYLFVSTAR